MKAREVDLEELVAWVQKNRHRTWNWEGPLPYNRLTLEMKYIRFNLDTRDMKVFAIDTDGMGRGVHASTHEEFDGTILELLEKRLNERKNDDEKPKRNR